MCNIYSKWLLVSDIDGTLNNKAMELPENNKVAINDYVEKGGYFTLCSGRNLESLAIHYNKLGIKTPAIFLNGAGIYDFSSKEFLDYSPISLEGEKKILDLWSEDKLLQLTVYTPDTIYVTKGDVYGYVIAKMDKLSHIRCKSTSDLPSGKWGKATLFSYRSKIKKLHTYFTSEENRKLFDCFLTSPYSLEIVNAGVNKGSAVIRLAEILGIDKDKTAAVGDYYNDVAMLKSVAHPVCCGQAPADIKEISEYVACHCNDGAVADFINYIENKYIR